MTSHREFISIMFNSNPMLNSNETLGTPNTFNQTLNPVKKNGLMKKSTPLTPHHPKKHIPSPLLDLYNLDSVTNNVVQNDWSKLSKGWCICSAKKNELTPAPKNPTDGTRNYIMLVNEGVAFKNNVLDQKQTPLPREKENLVAEKAYDNCL
ncbi:hypothetical protein Lal_00031878 [Lupinus albus]|nr:hypothetical protein Lal_00031878 [Lupinus albus]